MVERRDVEFGVDGGDRLRGWLFLPSKRAGPLPAISLAHGYAGVKEHGLERFARAFAEAGFVGLVHDHRNFGASDGAVRHDIDPWRQIADWRRAISFLETQPDVEQRGSEFGAPVTLAAMSWCSARPTAGSGLSSRKCPRSAATSKGCAAYRPMPSPPWSINSTRTSARSFEASRLGFSKWSMPIRQSRPPIGPPTPSRSISNLAGRRLEERGHGPIRSACKDVRTRPLGCPGLAHAAADDCRSRRQHHPDQSAIARLRANARAEEARDCRRGTLRSLSKTISARQCRSRVVVPPALDRRRS
jgi:hypothetical protein